jgi:hypothetical protein
MIGKGVSSRGPPAAIRIDATSPQIAILIAAVVTIQFYLKEEKMFSKCWLYVIVTTAGLFMFAPAAAGDLEQMDGTSSSIQVILPPDVLDAFINLADAGYISHADIDALISYCSGSATIGVERLDNWWTLLSRLAKILWKLYVSYVVAGQLVDDITAAANWLDENLPEGCSGEGRDPGALPYVPDPSQ